MRYDPDRHHRRSIRLREYDYSLGGSYFITICAHDRTCLFGDVVRGEMRLNVLGEIAAGCWRSIPDHFRTVRLDAYVIMPNHMHGIVTIIEPAGEVGATLVGARHASPLPTVPPTTMPRGPGPGSIGAVVGSYKSAVTRRINALRDRVGTPVWQRNYYERVIRDEDEFERIRWYIEDNPRRWAEDEYNPDR